jgi:hypothetical protein
VLTTNQKGAIAESAIALAAVRLDIGVFRPLMDERCDFVFDLRPRLIRVQCKWARRRGDIVEVRCRRCRRTADGLQHRGYTADEIDAFAAYCAELDRCFFLPIEICAGRLEIQLRLSPSRNNQVVGINWADDFDFGATISELKGP